MKLPSLSFALFFSLVVQAYFPATAVAWGATGHRLINRLAAQMFPPDLPAFVRTESALDEIEALGPEEDVLKDAGRSWDDDYDPGHYLDLGDDGTAYGVSLEALPQDMKAYAAALATAGKDPYSAGYLPYSIIDGYEQVRKDFALWRVDDYGVRRATDARTRAAFAAALQLREALTLRDIGVFGHFAGDGSQPLHVTIHYNGWGDYPNPQNYSTDRHLHAFFESAFVQKYARIEAVRALVKPSTPVQPAALLTQAQIASFVGAYLEETSRRVTPLYQIEAAHGFENGSPAAVAFVDDQLARGAAMLRDITVLAWQDSLNAPVGYPSVIVRDVLSGAAPAPAPAGSD